MSLLENLENFSALETSASKSSVRRATKLLYLLHIHFLTFLDRKRDYGRLKKNDSSSIHNCVFYFFVNELHGKMSL
jgi:hypothetical protein